jgi:iron complex transport system ATP-binding protein
MSDDRGRGDRLAARDIYFRRGHRSVLNGASLSVAADEVVCLLGQNGAGKTTLLRLMLGLICPAAGEVRLGAKSLAALPRRVRAQRLAYVPQLHQPPFPYLAREVVALGRIPAAGLFGMAQSGDRDVVDATLDTLGIGHLAERPYTQLSCGERQLVMIARAMAQGAGLLIMDEPLTGLDYGHQMRLIGRLRRLSGEGYGVLMTTHQPDHAMMVATRVATLIDGRIAHDGPPEQVVTSETIFRLYGVRMHSFGCAQSS